MSGILAGKVWLSNLAPHLKPLAAALADTANDDGTDIYPGVPYMAWKLGAHKRTVQFGMKALRDMKVLVLVANEKGGRGLRTEYRMDASALPARPAWSARSGKGEKSSSFIEVQKGGVESLEKGDPESSKGCNLMHQKGESCDTKGCNSMHERVKSDAVSDPLSLNDPSVPVSDPSIEHTDRAEALPFSLHETVTDQVTVLRARFERVIAVYPRVEKKKRAWKIFQALNPTDALTEFILADIEKKKRTVWGGVAPQYITSLVNYLLEERWTDDVSEIAPYSGAELARARQILGSRFLGRCPHGGACESLDACLKTIADRERQHNRRPARAS